MQATAEKKYTDGYIVVAEAYWTAFAAAQDGRRDSAPRLEILEAAEAAAWDALRFYVEPDPTLYGQGYRCRVNPGRVGDVRVDRPAEKILKGGPLFYIVNALSATCTCEGYFYSKPGHKTCSHVQGLGDLMARQIVECGRSGRADDYAVGDNLFALVDRICNPNSEMWIIGQDGVEAKPTRPQIPAPQYPPMEQMQREWNGLYEEDEQAVRVATVRRATPIVGGRMAA